MSGKTFIHENALCESKHIGHGTNIWAFTHVLPEAKIGAECNICDGVFIENDVIIEDRVTIKCGVQLWDGIHLEDDVFIGPNATFTNDLFPRSKAYPQQFLRTHVQQGASIGANATILSGITIGRAAMIGAGSVVTKDVPPHAVVMGNPARITSYNSSDNIEQADYFEDIEASKSKDTVTTLNINDCAIWSLPVIDDMRGRLMVTEFSKNIPFIPKRSFFVHAVPSNKIRGEHAHKKCQQFLIAINGELRVVIDDGINRQEITLDDPGIGLFIQANTWGIQYKFSSNAILCVYASHEYVADDYIREYSEFLKHVGQ